MYNLKQLTDGMTVDQIATAIVDTSNALLSTVAIASNTTIDDVAYLAVNTNYDGVHYVHNVATGTTYYSDVKLSGSVTSISADTNGVVTITIDGSEYNAKRQDFNYDEVISGPVVIDNNNMRLVNRNISATDDRTVKVHGDNVQISGSKIENTQAPAVAYGVTKSTSFGSVVGSTIKTPNYGVLLDTTGLEGGEGFIVSSSFIQSEDADAVEINTPGSGYKGVVVNGNVLATTAEDGPNSAGFAIGVADSKSTAIVGNAVTDSRLEIIHVEDTQKSTVVSSNAGHGRGDGVRVYPDNDKYKQGPVVIAANSLYNTNAENANYGVNLFWTTPGTSSGNPIVGNVLDNYQDGLHLGGTATLSEHVLNIAEANSLIDCDYAVTGWGSNYFYNRQYGTNYAENCDTLFYSRSKSMLFGKVVSKTAPSHIIWNAGLYDESMPSVADGFAFPHDDVAIVAGDTPSGGRTLFPLNGPAFGRVKVYGRCPSPNADSWFHISATLHYDGTTLTLTDVLSRVNGGITSVSLTETAPVDGLYLNVQSDIDTIATVMVDFDGEYWEQ